MKLYCLGFNISISVIVSLFTRYDILHSFIHLLPSSGPMVVANIVLGRVKNEGGDITQHQDSSVSKALPSINLQFNRRAKACVK